MSHWWERRLSYLESLKLEFESSLIVTVERGNLSLGVDFPSSECDLMVWLTLTVGRVILSSPSACCRGNTQGAVCSTGTSPAKGYFPPVTHTPKHVSYGNKGREYQITSNGK